MIVIHPHRRTVCSGWYSDAECDVRSHALLPRWIANCHGSANQLGSTTLRAMSKQSYCAADWRWTIQWFIVADYWQLHSECCLAI